MERLYRRDLVILHFNGNVYILLVHLLLSRAHMEALVLVQLFNWSSSEVRWLWVITGGGGGGSVIAVSCMF
jgi:hypothetical protein